jgi:hypothetical protein
VKKDTYRMASWWLLWEDLLFPEPGIEGKVVQRAKKFKAAGIDTVVIFGCHFRWDYIYNWDRFHLLLKFIVDSCHQEGIKVFDHHSANLTHRVNTLDEYRNINEKNRHHVPFFPSREFADTITFNGHKLNDFRMISVQDGQPCYLERYNAEIFCMNNIDFVDAYKKYVEKLLLTGIDGLMCDDVIYYPSWDGCGCEYCRKKFKDQYGHDLPLTTDESFWGNYESPAFKDWMNMRYHDPLDFLTAVKETVGADFPLMSCCSSSSGKALNGSGMSAEIMIKAMNNVMLEICGEIVSEKFNYSERVSNFMLHKAIADKHGHPNIGLGYAHNLDSAFVIWAFNKIFGSSAWISTLTGRFGVAEEVRKTIPDEADIIQEAFTFEKQNEDLFRGESSAKFAVLFSLDNLMYNGCAQTDYSQPWQDITTELFKQNIQFDVVLDIPAPDKYPVLLLSNFDCVSSEISSQLLDYMKQGGTIIAAGLLGFRNERGVLKGKSFLADLGTEFRNGKFDWDIPVADLFDPGKCFFNPSISSYDIYRNGTKTAQNQWISSGSFHWLPKTCTASTLDKVKKLLPPEDIEILCPEGWIYRVLKDNDKYFIHLLASNIEAVPYQHFRNNLANHPIIESLNFRPDTGTVSITASAAKAILHSPDLPEAVNLEGVNGDFSFKLNNIKRYLIIELYC